MGLPRFDTAQLTLFRTPFNDPDFIFELKHDGFRGLAYIETRTLKSEGSGTRAALKEIQFPPVTNLCCLS